MDYKLDDEVLIFDPKLKKFSKEGKVLSFDRPPSDLLGPRDYTIEFKEGGTRRVNQQWLIPAPVPPSAWYFDINSNSWIYMFNVLLTLHLKSTWINKKIYSIEIIPLLDSKIVLSLSHIDLQSISEHSASFYLSH